MFYTKSGGLAGAIGVYVDDFLFVESRLSDWAAIMKSVKALYSWGEAWILDFCAVWNAIQATTDYSATLDQRK